MPKKNYTYTVLYKICAIETCMYMHYTWIYLSIDDRNKKYKTMLKRYWYRDLNLDNVKSKSDPSLLHPDLQTLLILANSETLVAQLFDFGPTCFHFGLEPP